MRPPEPGAAVGLPLLRPRAGLSAVRGPRVGSLAIPNGALSRLPPSSAAIAPPPSVTLRPIICQLAAIAVTQPGRCPVANVRLSTGITATALVPDVAHLVPVIQEESMQGERAGEGGRGGWHSRRGAGCSPPARRHRTLLSSTRHPSTATPCTAVSRVGIMLSMNSAPDCGRIAVSSEQPRREKARGAAGARGQLGSSREEADVSSATLVVPASAP
jgi:hypothetical protein